LFGERAVEHIDFVVPEFGCIEKVGATVVRQGQSLVSRTAVIRVSEDGVVRIDAARPTGNHPRFTRVNE
jgi:hypothetical protein